MAKSLAIASLQILSVLLLASLAQSETVYTHLTAYENQIRSGNDQTAFPVAGLPNVTWDIDQFGSVYIADNILKETESFDSVRLGSSQGIIAVSSLDNTTLKTLASVVFTTGKYAGSTLELAGIISQTEAVNEMPIVGGTRDFRYATGYSTFGVYSVEGDHFVVRMELFIKQDIPDDYREISLH